MSDQDFENVCTEIAEKSILYNSAQRTALLGALKSAVAGAFAVVGPPQPEPKKDEPKKDAAKDGVKDAKSSSAPAGAGGDASKDNKKAGGGGGDDHGTSVTGSRSSTKVSHAPGGASSISFGGDSSDAGQQKGRKLFSSHGQSSLQFGDGETRSDVHTSTRVRHAPGGDTSVQIGGDTPTSGGTSERNSQKARGNTASNDESAPKKHRSAVHITHAPGGASSDIFGSGDGKASAVTGGRSSTKTSHAPGGNTSISIGDASTNTPSPAPSPSGRGGAPASSDGSKDAKPSDDTDLSNALLTEIASAINRKGKTKETFTRFTQNKGKTLQQEDLKQGVISLGIPFSDSQAAAMIVRFASVGNGMTYSDFVKILQFT
jgi:hypothetical protein